MRLDRVLRSPRPSSSPWQQLRSRGADPYYGLQLAPAFEALGLADVRTVARVSVMRSGTPSMEFNILTLQQVGARLVEQGTVTAHELEHVLECLRRPGLSLTSAIMIAVSGTLAV